ncbi:hypothetical protein A3A75_01800 [Candidatus Woesebacteria bacterium RIFCSPLOWO2_01_FULL_39_10]|uniref:Glycosyltransferase RgtA/B/C/D-like domain-containing protein n=1 Tax=Candidatus Woesebacteria bacterium RIFCSPLOWO2_01_FULL_39_10 TaxID=1802516 RepID=A0A1F8B7U5_9BACT|nr:MAG: hypothetical protein A3A75_01800 [Candidatus Woesebacteria bacterium RIFCSPLOWO2_01_FULL_39_10]
MRKLLFGVILSSAFLLRVFALDVIPVGFTPDEASFGYDAYSLLKTAKDQWGHSFPLVLESFGDFKLPAYAYLSAPSVAMFGLNKFAVRLPNALLGTFAVYITYLLVLELQNSMRNKLSTSKAGQASLIAGKKSIAIISAVLLTISPWHIMMSRGAFEANLTTFFLPLGILLFLKGLKKVNLLYLSALVFGFNLFTYHSARFVTPLLVLILVVVYWNKINKLSLKSKIIPSFLFGMFCILSAYTLFIGGAARAKDISIFSGALNEASDKRIIAIYQGMSPTVARIFHNKYEVAAKRFLNNYTSYFSQKFLFVDGPAETTYGMIPGRGVLYWFELPLIFGFLYALFKQKEKNPLLIILFWILIAPIPAALTTGKGFAANRAVVSLPAIQIALAYGALALYGFIKHNLPRTLTRLTPVLGTVIVLLFTVSFLEDYFLLSPYKSAEGMLYGNLEVASWLKENSQDKEQVVVSKRLSEPHIYIAFANVWDPKEYQREIQAWKIYKDQRLLFIDQLEEYKLGKYTFRSIKYPADQTMSKSLLVGKLEEFPKDVFVIKQFSYLTGKPAVIVVQPTSEAYAQKTF